MPNRLPKSAIARAPKLRQPASVTPSDLLIEAGKDSEFTASMQLAYLESVVKDWQEQSPSARPESKIPPDAALAEEPIKGPFSTPFAKNIRPVTIAKSLIAVAIALALGWLPAHRLLATMSAEAVVNARIITLRAPIEGEVAMSDSGIDIGSPFRVGQSILTVSNPRADSSHLTSLTRDRDQLRTNIRALEAKKQLLLANIDDLSSQQERFRLGRIEQLEQRVREADTDIASAQAQYSVTSDAMKRAKALRETDAVSQAFLDKAAGDAHVAEQAVRGQIERRKGMLVELEAAKRGTFVGDSYNDTPQSAQRKMEISIELSDVEARLVGSKAELATVETEIAKEEERHAELSKVDIHSTVNGRVWEMLTAPGEHVNAGQDLVKLLDCGSAIVTASVSETTYQRLVVGQAAMFRPRDGGPSLTGTIVGLNGLAAVASNSAIQQSALSREPYHVTLRFPDLAKNGACMIGRSGLVEFDTASSAVSSAAY